MRPIGHATVNVFVCICRATVVTILSFNLPYTAYRILSTAYSLQFIVFCLPFTAIVCPQKVYGRLLPLIIMGSVTLLGAFVSFFLPETLHQHLPETMAEGENFGKGQPHIRWRW